MRAAKKNPKTTVSDINNNLQSAGVKVTQSTSGSKLQQQSTVATPEDEILLISNKNRKARLEFASFFVFIFLYIVCIVYAFCTWYNSSQPQQRQ